MKTYFKTVVRLFKKHLMRFFSIIFIVVVSVGLIAGIGSSAEVIDNSLSDHYVRQNVSDLIVKSTADGFDANGVDKIRRAYGDDSVQLGMSLDVKLTVKEQESDVRLYFLDFSDWKVNTVQRVSGKTAAELDDTASALCVEAPFPSAARRL